MVLVISPTLFRHMLHATLLMIIMVVVFGFLPVFISYALYPKVEDVAVIVRGKMMTLPQKRRIEQYNQTVSRYFDFWMFYDATGSVNYHHFYITSNDVLKVYPKLQSIRDRCSKLTSLSNAAFYQRISFTESVIIWLEQFGHKYSQIWVFEQDLGYAGNIGNFFYSYYEDKTDFLLLSYEEMKNKTYDYRSCQSDKFNERIKSENTTLYVTNPILIRFSRRALEYIHEEHAKGFHANSGQFIPYMIQHYNLTYKMIDSKYIGEFNTKYPINESRWMDIQWNYDKKNKFYHPVNF